MEKKETIQHIWSVLCSNSVVDQETNNMSMYNTLEKLTINIPKEALKKISEDKKKGFTFQFPYQVVSMFSRLGELKETAIDMKLEITNPDGEIALKSERKIAINKGIKNLRIRDLSDSLPISKEGDYWIKVYYKVVSESRYKLATELPLEIVIKTEEGK